MSADAPSESLLPKLEDMEAAGFHFSLPTAAKEPLDANAPLVVVLGWYGAQDKHVAKYSALLNKRGYPTVRAIMPRTAVFSPILRPRRRFAAQLLDFLDSLGTDMAQRRLCFYTFSNGGGFALEQVDWLVHNSKQYQHLASRVAGTVFDSAPCYMHPLSGASAIGHGFSLPLRVLAAALFWLGIAVMLVIAPTRPWDYWRSMQNLRLGSKSLYLYSEDDPLCDHSKLDELVAARRRQLGTSKVAAVKWERSQHVAHLRCHMREYTEALFGFLRSITPA